MIIVGPYYCTHDRSPSHLLNLEPYTCLVFPLALSHNISSPGGLLSFFPICLLKGPLCRHPKDNTHWWNFSSLSYLSEDIPWWHWSHVIPLRNFFWDRVSLCNSSGCPGACFVDQAGPTESHPPLPPECSDCRHAPPLPINNFKRLLTEPIILPNKFIDRKRWQ